MFPTRASEGDRNTLPPISSLSSSHEPLRDLRPSSAHDHHRSPPAGLLPRPPREMEPLRPGPFPRSAEEAYTTPTNPNFALNGPPPPFRRDMERGSPVSDESVWRSYDRPDPRFGAKEGYSPHVSSAPNAARDDGRTAPWQRPSDDSHRPRMPAPPAGMRDDGPWRQASTSRDRADLHPEAFGHERAREEERWREERGGRPMHPYDAAPGYPSVGPYGQDVRAGVRPLDADYADGARRIRRRATSSLVEEEQNAQRYPMSGARPHGLTTYSPPGSRSQSAAPNQAPMRPGMMAGMEPPRPASTLGVMPNAPTAASAASAQVPTTTNTVNANRRVAHLLSEQKRRESINTGFEDLRQAIPACRDGQDSKATILKRALEYIRELESVVERQHRPPLESPALDGYNNRSPPDDKDDIRRFSRPGGDEDRRGSTRQITGGSGSSSDAGSGPRIGGLPSNAFGGAPNGYPSAHAPPHVRAYPPFGSHNLPLAAHNLNMEAARSTVDQTRSGPINSYHGPNGSVAKRWAEDSNEDQRSPSRRRVSDGDQDEVQRSPTGSNYLIAPGAHSRSTPLMRSAHFEKPRDWHSRLDNKTLVDSAVRV
ncbi:uncharacterized protein UTRI_05412 [Ustilago trichophora]|uniref:BHLH domain-containing protein n=1 Tax=Ustilago trichophora TaxID=86804 RepID=A0A5C3EH37_9BASI|nr:uncharacterized protein UTRI_05412 [Ustilago trichophora]